MASKAMIVLYFLIALAVVASVLVEEDEIDNSNALNVEDNDTQGVRSESKQFLF